MFRSVQRQVVYERWDRKVDRSSACWIWNGTRRNGYGVMWISNVTFYAHRVSYELFVGPIPDGMVVCHRCDTPLCVCPDHLFVGTRADNNADMDMKGRRRCVGPKGLSHPRAKLTEHDVASLRRLHAAGVNQRELAAWFGIGQYCAWQVVHGLGRFASESLR